MPDQRYQAYREARDQRHLNFEGTTQREMTRAERAKRLCERLPKTKQASVLFDEQAAAQASEVAKLHR